MLASGNHYVYLYIHGAVYIARTHTSFVQICKLSIQYEYETRPVVEERE